MAARQVYEQTPDVALEFFRLSYPKRAFKSTLKPEMPDLQRNEESVVLTAATANPPVVHGDAAGAAAAAPQPDTAVQVSICPLTSCLHCIVLEEGKQHPVIFNTL